MNKPDMVMHICNPNLQEEEKDLKFKVILAYKQALNQPEINK